ncbi:MAG: TatD family hydrolase [Methanomassiliicoccales archaeon]
MNREPIFDNHVHLQRSGKFIEAAREFERAGGTGILLVNLPPDGDVCSPNYFMEMYTEAVSIKEEVKRATTLDVLLALGPYPVTALQIAERMGAAAAEEKVVRAAELAIEFIQEGKAEALGEIGRPHFNVPDELWIMSNNIMKECLKLAAREGCAAILHTEEATISNMREIAEMAKSVNMPVHRTVRHHSPPLVDEEENFGLIPSVKATRENIRKAAMSSDRFVMETDYLDDPSRPGAVLGIRTVPRRTRELMEERLADRDFLRKIHLEIPCSIYGSENFSNV